MFWLPLTVNVCLCLYNEKFNYILKTNLMTWGTPVVETNEQSQLLIKTKQVNTHFSFLYISASITYGGLITKQ